MSSGLAAHRYDWTVVVTGAGGGHGRGITLRLLHDTGTGACSPGRSKKPSRKPSR